MKMNPTPKFCGFALAALLFGGASVALAQVPDRTINSFTSSIDGSGVAWGSSTASWDATQDATGDGGGSLYIQTTWGGSDTPGADYITLPGDNYWWSGGGTFNFSDYLNLQFDIKWDPNSVVTLDEWNDPSTFPLVNLSGSIGGLEVNTANGNGGGTTLTNIQIPAAAALGWVHVVIPIDSSLSGIDPGVGIFLHKWLNNSSSLNGLTNSSGQYTNTANFWIDNVMLKGTAAPPPPPTVLAPFKAEKGLNVFASTRGNSYYDRQEVVSRQSTGLEWVGQATGANPVTYSFTITNFPTDPATYDCEAYLFLSPNPGSIPSAPDWNNPNCAIAFMQVGTNGAIMHFQYKVDEPNNNMMYSTNNNPDNNPYTNAPGTWDGVTADYLETGDLGSVTNPSPLGTWSVKFTSDTDVTLTAPDGSTSSFSIPSYNASKLAATASGFDVFLGFQANNEASLNRAAVYSSFSVSGSLLPLSDDFMADTMLDTNVWDNSISGGPRGVLVVPDNTSYWLPWTLPDAGFNPQVAPDLSDPNAWTSPSIGPVVPMVSQKAQLIATSELPAGSAAYFRLLKRVYSQLQILLPGETNAPDTPTGKTGTPDPIGPSALVDVTINAVDSTWHIVNVTGDIITLNSSDVSDILPLDAPLQDGTLTQTIWFDNDYSSPGTRTITASDTTNTNIVPGTVSVTVSQ